MKKLSLMALAAAGMLAVGCADKDVVEQAANSDYNLVPGQNSWLAVGIALPDDGTTTRANEDLVDGEASEFAVKSAKLILFKGGTEAGATYFGEYALTPTTTFANETGDNVPEGNKEGTTASGYGEITTTSQRYVTQISNPNLGAEDKLWAYVILNYDGNSTGISATTGTTFAEFSRQVFKAIGISSEANGQGSIDSEHGLVMTSVPIANAAGGTAAPATGTKVTTLSEVQSSAIFKTKDEAQKSTNPLTCCYVERAAVKVELRNSVSKLTDNTTAFAVKGWALGNVNNNASGYYNTRQFNTDWMGYANEEAPFASTKYRMVGRTAFFTSGHTPNGYRTYFGEDVNFSGNTGLIKTTLATTDYIDFSPDPTKNVLYTYENTIDENSMIYKNTTYVGVKAQVGNGADFWVEEGQPKTKLDDAAAIAGRVKVNASTTFDQAVSTINAAITADLNATTSTILDAAGKAAGDIDEVSYDLGATVTLGTVATATAEQAYTYQITISNIVAKKLGTEVTLTAEKQTAMEDAVKALTDVATVITPADRTLDTKFYKYTGGISYYTMRIAHFGGTDVAGGTSGDKNFANGETPWSAPGLAYNDYDKIYPMNGQSLHETPINYGTSRAAAWLGRWSIVRNNWYVLDIKEVEGLGSPVPVDYSGSGVGPTPDDNPGREYYIAAEIHILPWAKRYQSVKF